MDEQADQGIDTGFVFVLFWFWLFVFFFKEKALSISGGVPNWNPEGLVTSEICPETVLVAPGHYPSFTSQQSSTLSFLLEEK